ncbi:hypothetical protein QAD02_016950 [Eretmocerus hayati]|uniref:Uncharacterized protein n=1 Tax=Eretmocerus hayati TaxID=131215 RepID=A0ACC2PDK8_9HYME|nr:hypothetical protein QAD02_016950 [Eretmocerus hayati]
MALKKNIVSCVIGLLALFLGILVLNLNFNIDRLTEKEKCPACFGISACPDIATNKIRLKYLDFYSFLNSLMSVKNVYSGEYNDQNVVLKKLAHQSELEDFDKLICSDPGLLELCVNKQKPRKLKTNFQKLIMNELSGGGFADPDNKITLCPSTDGFDQLISNTQILQSADEKDLLKYLWTIVKINPEPLLLQILQADNNWPVPKYFGACGRTIVEEYVGLPLSSYLNEPWMRRAKIASSLLDAAYKFTFMDPKFSYYLTDISIDNIAVNNLDQAIFVDLENIIIVDRQPPLKDFRKLEKWNHTHKNQLDIDCQDCYVFSPIDICSHKFSDHNFYAVCQHILGHGLGTSIHKHGFLQNPPQDILKKYPNFSYLLEQCSIPDISISRIDMGNQLKHVLDTMITEVR